MAPEHLQAIGGRHLDGSAVAVLVPTVALLPVALLALAVFWAPVRLFVPVPYWAFAAGYLAGGILMFLRPVQRGLLHWLFGARQPTPDELGRIEPAWHEITTQAGLPPDRYVMAVVDSDELNAYACGGHVVAVSTGALARLPDDELRGVLAHELGHHLGLHTFALTVQHWLALPIVTLARIGFVIEDMADAFSETLDERVPALSIVGRVVSALLQVVAWLFLSTVQLARGIGDWMGRSSELAADRRAVAMGYGPDLARALRRVQAADRRAGSTDRSSLFGTHPSATLRAARIEAMLRQTQR